MIDPMIPTVWKLWMLSEWCWIRFCRKPPTNDPTMPSTMVPKKPMGSRPGSSSRAMAPAMRPMIISTIMKVTMPVSFPAPGFYVRATES